jgi:TPR repeat protein
MAADGGLVEGMYSYGVCLSKGHGIPQDDGEAAKYFQTAAERGFSEAEFAYGVVLAKGIGVQKDHDQAMEYLKRAAHHGNDAALVALMELRSLMT